MTVQPLYQRMLHLGLDTVQSRITRLISRAVLSSRGFTMLTGSSRKENLDPGFRAKLDFVKDFCKILFHPIGLLGIISIKQIVIILQYFLYLPHQDKPQIQHVLQ